MDLSINTVIMSGKVQAEVLSNDPGNSVHSINVRPLSYPLGLINNLYLYCSWLIGMNDRPT